MSCRSLGTLWTALLAVAICSLPVHAATPLYQTKRFVGQLLSGKGPDIVFTAEGRDPGSGRWIRAAIFADGSFGRFVPNGYGPGRHQVNIKSLHRDSAHLTPARDLATILTASDTVHPGITTRNFIYEKGALTLEHWFSYRKGQYLDTFFSHLPNHQGGRQDLGRDPNFWHP